MCHKNLPPNEPEPLADFAGGCGLIEGVEVDAGDAVVEEVGALFGRIMEADLADGGGRFARALEGFEEFGGEAAAAGEFRHALHRREARDRHDSRDDRCFDSGDGTAFAEVVEVMVVEEKLGADVVRARVHLGFQVVHFEQAIGRGRVTFRKSRNADAKSSLVRVAGEFFDEANQIRRLGKSVARVVVVRLIARRVTAEGEDVAHAGGGVAFENRRDLLFGVADACEVGNGIERRGSLEPHDEFVGEFARRSACAVGDADKVRVDFFEIPNRGVELFLGLGRLWWKKLEGYGRLAGLENVSDVHAGDF